MTAINFDNEKQKKDSLISSLRQFQNSTGWKILIKALKNDVEQAEARLHGEAKLKKGETIEYWQQIRSDRIGMLELPETLINDNLTKEKFDPDLDPYD